DDAVLDIGLQRVASNVLGIGRRAHIPHANRVGAAPGGFDYAVVAEDRLQGIEENIKEAQIREEIGVVPAATIENVPTRAAVEYVVSILPQQSVIAIKAENRGAGN